MTTKQRALVTVVAVASVGTATVTLPADPASAHETNLRLGNSSAAVGEGHKGLRVCNRDPGYTAVIRYTTWTDPIEQELPDPFANDGDCFTRVESSSVYKWRLCLEHGGGCTGWKRP
jgi:hypothetical protein